VVAAVVIAGVAAWPYLDGIRTEVLAAATALGLTRASVLLSVRGRLDQWSRLLWDRALAQKIVEVTLTLDSVLPPPPRERRLRVKLPHLHRPLAARAEMAPSGRGV
jgi:hypothetical protein